MVQLTLVKTPASFTGYSFVSLDDKASPGCPASVFSIALFRAYADLLRENAKLVKTVERQNAIIGARRAQSKQTQEVGK